MRDGMMTYPGLPGPVVCDFLSREESRARYASGTEFQIGKIELVSNTGTYVDTPFHRYPDGDDLARQPLWPPPIEGMGTFAVRAFAIDSYARLPRPMRRGRTFWAIGGGVVVAAVAMAGCAGGSGSSSSAASSPATAGSAGGSSQAHTSAPVVAPPASGTYLSDLKPSGNLSEQVNSGPVKISGSIYPKSLSFYCSVGDPTPFPKYALAQNARRFQVTLGLPANSPSGFGAAVMLLGDGRTLRTVTVKAGKPKTVAVSVKGVHTLQLECYGSGNSATGGEAVGLEWGNARVSGGG